MSNTFGGGFVTVTQPGTSVTTGATSARVALPSDAAGNNPRFVRVAATGESYIRIGNATVVATTNDTLVQPSDSVLMATNGATNLAYIQGAASAKVNVVPLENV